MKSSRLLLVGLGLVLARSAYGVGTLSGGVSLDQSGAYMSSYGWAQYILIPGEVDHNEMINGQHYVYDVGSGAVIATRSFGPTRNYGEYIGGNGSAGSCYRASLAANMTPPYPSNFFTSGQRCAPTPPPPADDCCGLCIEGCPGWPRCIDPPLGPQGPSE